VKMARRETGQLGERLAREFLEKNGFSILDSNYRCAEGEIDIVARRGEWLVFVEVRTKSGPAFGTPEESVTARKKDKLITAAQHYIQNHEGLPSSWRIDFVAVELDHRGKPQRIELIENAVTGDV
jgi:putative endonuclease